MNENIENERVTMNLKKGLVNKLDLLRYGSESWNRFLENAYPILVEWRENEREKKRKEICERG